MDVYVVVVVLGLVVVDAELCVGVGGAPPRHLAGESCMLARS